MQTTIQHIITKMAGPGMRLLLAPMCLFTACGTQAQEKTFQPTPHYQQRVGEFDVHPAVKAHSIVMLGNSLTENGGNWNVRLHTQNVVNYGIIGDDTEGMLHRLQQITPHHPRAIFLLCGVNDLSHQLSAQEVFDRVTQLIETLRRQTPQTTLYIQSLLPINEDFQRWKTLNGKTNDIPAINRLLKTYCQAKGLTFIDIYPHMVEPGTAKLEPTNSTDGLHLSKKGYQIWAEVLRPYAQKEDRAATKQR